MKCLECESQLVSINAKKFCNRSCAAKYNNKKRTENGWTPSIEHRVKVSLKLSGRKCPSKTKGKLLAPRDTRICPECNSPFTILSSKKQKYCSTPCRQKNMGGYREGSGKSKSGYYKGIYSGSTYELVWIIYQIDHNIPFERFNQILKYNNKKYMPDFLQNDNIVEIKGYEREQLVDIKNNIAKQHGYKVTVLRKKDLEKEFNWVKQNYKYKQLYELYDNYKPQYVYSCDQCGVTFSREREIKRLGKFCSRQCSGTYRCIKNHALMHTWRSGLTR